MGKPSNAQKCGTSVFFYRDIQLKDAAWFAQLLGLCAPWRITAITPDLPDKPITIHIDWPKGTKGSCSVCNALCPVYDHREQRAWRHLDTMQFKTRLVAQVPRIYCKEHGIKSLKAPWADTKVLKKNIMSVEQEKLSKLTKMRREHVQSCDENGDHSHRLVATLYSDAFRFIYELLQNADDAEASYIEFTLTLEDLQVRHDGNPFDFNDVESITAIGSSTKEEVNSIGKFGAGFKSVFAVTNTPHIHSGAYHFKIVDYIVPEQVEPLNIEKQTTIIKLPFKHDMPLDSNHEGISRILEEELKSESLLFLKNIRTIIWQTGSNYGNYSVETNGARKSLIAQFNQQDSATDYLMFEEYLEIDDKKLRIVIAYQISADKDKAIVATPDDKLFVFFPTKETAGLNFLIHAPYKTTPNRETIDFADEQNHTITEALSTLIAKSIQSIKAAGFLSVDFLNLLPIDSSNKDALHSSAFAKVKSALKNEELLPTSDGEYMKAEEVLLARGKNLTTLLKQPDCDILFKRVAWLSTAITYDKTRELRRYLIDTLGIPEVNMEAFCAEITVDFMATKADEWVVEFYSNLLESKALYTSGKILHNRPIIRLEDDSHINPKNDEDGLQVYLPSKMKSEFKTVKRKLVENEKSLEFLKDLGLKKPDNIAEIKEFIVPKYKDRGIEIAIAEYQKDFEKARGIWQESDESDRYNVTELLKPLHFVRCINQRETSSYQKPTDVYFRTNNLLVWYDGNQEDDTYFLEDDTYFLEAGTGTLLTTESRDFLHRLGVQDTLKMYHTKSADSHRHGCHKQGVNGFNQHFDIHGLEYVIEHITLEKSVFLWSILLRHTNRLKGCIETTSNLNDPYVQGPEQSSKAMETLSGKSWLYNKSGELITSPIADIKLDTLHDDYKKADDKSEKLEKVLGMKLDAAAKFSKEHPDLIVVPKEKYKRFKEWERSKEGRKNEYVAESTAEPWQPAISPEDATITEIKFTPKRHESKDLSNQMVNVTNSAHINMPTTEKGESASPSPNPAAKKAIGVWGEQYALRHLAKKYPQNEVICCNEPGSVAKGYDIVMKEKGKEIAYFEVKATVKNSPTTFKITKTQWDCARDLHHKNKGDMYVILLVFNAGKENVSIKEIKNPVERWKLGELQADPVNIIC